MPEIKQNFTRGKMNKDLDERLIPKGEYREAQNIHISESEGSDVGAIENILSNINVTTAITAPSNADTEDYEVIGYCKDLAKKRIIYFVTNFRGKVFTDNIRTIDRQLAAGTSQYADLRHHSYIVMYDIEEAAQYTLVAGAWLNLSKNHLITGVQIIDDLLFWTDNFNQPRKINIQTAVEQGSSYYDCEETISVAKYSPYKAIMLHNDAGTSGLPSLSTSIESDYMKEKFIRFSYRYKYDDGEYSLIAPFTQAVFEPLNSGIITNSDTSGSEDDERNTTTGEPTVLTGKKEVYKKGIVDIMQNRVNQVELRIPLPNKNEFATTSPGSTYSNPYHIEQIDILVKESDGISFKLVKSVKVSEIPSTDIEVYTFQARDDTSKYYRQVYKYTYKSSEPYEVLTEDQVNRVYDQVPLMAKTLEIVGNRVVFGNYVENYPYPTDISGKKGINYTVSSTTKGAVDQVGSIASEPYLYGLKQWMHKAYKYHTVKQRRTYQVGIVFSDIFGRQSPVILSSNTSEANPDTYTMPIVATDNSANTNGVWNTTHNSYGKSLAIQFEDNDFTDDSKFVANMTALSSVYNPHGWYSYRIVVKQQEQEYYNIYAPHTFDGWNNISEQPEDTLTGGRSWLFLHGDNVNKVPRSLNDTDLNRDGTMGSNVRLYPKVIFDTDGESKMNDSYHELTEVISLGTAYEQNLYISGDDNKSGTGGFSIYNFIYGKNKNPLVAELQNMKAYTGDPSNNQARAYYLYSVANNTTTIVLGADQLGNVSAAPTDFVDDDFNGWSVNMSNIPHNEELTVTDTEGTAANKHEIIVSANQDFDDIGDKIILSNYYEGLSVFETEPFKSKLDIYYETSTSGLVADLVQEIITTPTEQPTQLTIKQDTYSFGSGQPPVATTPATNPDGSARYGAIAFLYENITSGTFIGDLDATEAADNTGTKNLSFALHKATRLGDSSDVTNSFAIATNPDTSNTALKAVGAFAFRGNTFDNYNVQIKVTDNTSGGIAYMSVTVFIKNSVPTVTVPTGPQEVRVDSGANAIVINSSNNVTNGSLLTSGDVNKFSNLTVSHSFEDNTISDNLFTLSVPRPGEYELRTSTRFTLAEAAAFFARSNDDRTVTITVTDASGLEANDSVRIDQDTSGIAVGVLKITDSIDKSDICAALSLPNTTYYAVAATGSDPTTFAQGSDQLVANVNNVVYTDITLTKTAPANKYVSFKEQNVVRVIDIDSSGVVTSVTDINFDQQIDCRL